MVIRNILHLDIFNGKIVVVERHTICVLFSDSIDQDGQAREAMSLNCIKVQFSMQRVKVTRTQCSFRLAPAGTVHKGNGQIRNKVKWIFVTYFFSSTALHPTLSCQDITQRFACSQGWAYSVK